MRFVILTYALLIFVSLVSAIYTMWAYHHCPNNRSHKPLVFPMVCSIAWFLVAIDQLAALTTKTHGSVDGATFVVLISITLIALIYFVKAYILERHRACPLPQQEREYEIK